MKKYVALLRGINVGGNCKVEMSRLKKTFEDLGYKNVLTYINSGNVIFETNKLDLKKIEITLKKTFGFEIKVLVRDSENIQNLCKKLPKTWQNNAEQKTDILFLWDKYDNKKSLGLIKINAEVDELKYLPGAIAWHIDKKFYNKSAMHKFIGSEVYKNMTARNINTLRKLAELMK